MSSDNKDNEADGVSKDAVARSGGVVSNAVVATKDDVAVVKAAGVSPDNGGVTTSVGSAGLRMVTGDETPRVENTGKISQLAKRFGELAPRLDIYEVNDELVYYNHRGDRKIMTGRVFMGWIENYVSVVGGYDRKSGAALPGSLNLADSMAVLVQDDFLRGVRRISRENRVRLPVVRENGAMELLPWGYDAETEVYTVPKGLEYALDWDVAEGKRWFDRWFGSMPYLDDRSKAVMVAGLLVLFIKHLPGGNALTPGFLWEANLAGSGKSLCGKACLMAVLGYAPVGKKKKDEEMDKEIESHIKSKSPVIFLDNLYGNLQNATIDQLLTSKTFTFREMGGQRMVTLRNDAPVMVTGNELKKNDDAFRRFLQCYLFEKGNPGERVVKDLLDDDVMESDEWRSEALASLWSFVQCWEAKGRPDGPTQLGSFEQFSKLIGGIVMACGYDDPIERPGEDGVAPDKADFLALMSGVYHEMKEEDLKVKMWGFEDLARIARKLDIFADKVGDEAWGKTETVKRDKISAEFRADAPDMGYLDAKQLQRWQGFLKPKIGTEPSFDGVKVRFGDLGKEKRKTKFTVEVLG